MVNVLVSHEGGLKGIALITAKTKEKEQKRGRTLCLLKKKTTTTTTT